MIPCRQSATYSRPLEIGPCETLRETMKATHHHPKVASGRHFWDSNQTSFASIFQPLIPTIACRCLALHCLFFCLPVFQKGRKPNSFKRMRRHRLAPVAGMRAVCKPEQIAANPCESKGFFMPQAARSKTTRRTGTHRMGEGWANAFRGRQGWSPFLQPTLGRRSWATSRSLASLWWSGAGI